MNLLVTGGNGFLGKHVIKQLRRQYPEAILWMPDSKKLNLTEDLETEQFFQNHSVDVVIHLAAVMAGIGELTKNPLPYLEKNLLLNYNLVYSAANYGVKKFITLGSSCGYSNDTPLPMKEEYFWKEKPENTYGICKLILLEHLQYQTSMDWVYLIPGNLYGPGDHFGEENTHLIPATVRKFEKALAENQKYIEVWGDGSQIRDFIYVEDVAELIAEAVKSPKYSKQPMNISVGQGYSVKEIVTFLKEGLGGQALEVVWAPDKPTGIHKKLLDNTRFRAVNSEYEFMSMEKGIQNTLSWYQETKRTANS